MIRFRKPSEGLKARPRRILSRQNLSNKLTLVSASKATKGIRPQLLLDLIDWMLGEILDRFGDDLLFHVRVKSLAQVGNARADATATKPSTQRSRKIRSSIAVVS
jgi:hypothetical protein